MAIKKSEEGYSQGESAEEINENQAQENILSEKSKFSENRQLCFDVWFLAVVAVLIFEKLSEKWNGEEPL